MESTRIQHEPVRSSAPGESELKTCAAPRPGPKNAGESLLGRRRLLGALIAGVLGPWMPLGRTNAGIQELAPAIARDGTSSILIKGAPWTLALRDAFYDVEALAQCGRLWQAASVDDLALFDPEPMWHRAFGERLIDADPATASSLRDRFAARRDEDLRARRVVQLDGVMFAVCERDLALIASSAARLAGPDADEPAR